MFEWQLAQMTLVVLRKSTRPPLALPAMLVNGNTPVYGAMPPMSVGAGAISAGNFVHANVSCTQRTRRNARLPKNCLCTPGCVRRPTVVGAPLLQSAGVNALVVRSNVGQVPEVAVSRSRYERFATTTCA